MKLAKPNYLVASLNPTTLTRFGFVCPRVPNPAASRIPKPNAAGSRVPNPNTLQSAEYLTLTLQVAEYLTLTLQAAEYLTLTPVTLRHEQHSGRPREWHDEV